MASFYNRTRLAYRTVRRRFGVWGSPGVTASLFGFLRTGIWIGQRADVVWYRKKLAKPILNPIVIVGNPRTGTTFLQRFLDQNGVGVGQQIWQQLYPSLCIQRVLRPLLPLLERISPARHHSTVAHQTSITSVETDDASLFFRFFDGFFLYGFILAHADEDVLPWFDKQYRDTSQRDFHWLREVWKRNLIAREGDRVLAKLFSIGADVGSFQQAFPDANILYMARDPIEVIPSCLSLLTGVLEKRFQYSRLSVEEKRRYCHRMTDALLELMRRFVNDWKQGTIQKERIMIVPYERLMNDFEALLEEIALFVNHPMDLSLRQEVQKQAQIQATYQSKHRYDLSQFYLEEEDLREKASFFYSFVQEVS